jgi:hypothetical protein
MKKLKQFFSPIEGGWYDGYTFGQFCKSPQRWFPPLINILFMLVPIFHIQELTLEAFIFVELFLFFIFCVWSFKTLQHWSDLKKHTSR